MIFDDTPNAYITKRMLEILKPSLQWLSQYERVPSTGLRWLLEKCHIVRPRYKPILEMPVSKTLRIKRYQRLKLPDDTITGS